MTLLQAGMTWQPSGVRVINYFFGGGRVSFGGEIHEHPCFSVGEMNFERI